MQPKQMEISREREYIRRQAPRQSSWKLERRNEKKKKNPDQARIREEIYTRRGSSWNQRNTPGFKDTSKSTLHFERCTSLSAVRPHPAYRSKGEACFTHEGSVPGRTTWKHTRSYGYVGTPCTSQRKHPVNQAFREGGGAPLTPNRDQRESGERRPTLHFQKDEPPC